MEELNKLQQYIKHVNESIYSMVFYYSFFRSLNDLFYKVDESLSNRELAKKYNFLYFSFLSYRKLFVLEICKIVDIKKDTISLYKILNYIEQNQKILDKQSLIYFIEKDFSEIYISNEINFSIDIRKELQMHDDLINRVKNIRDKIIAHNDFKKGNDFKDNTMNIFELDKLIKELQEIINKIDLKFNSSQSYYGSLIGQANDSVNKIFTGLKK